MKLIVVLAVPSFATAAWFGVVAFVVGRGIREVHGLELFWQEQHLRWTSVVAVAVVTNSVI